MFRSFGPWEIGLILVIILIVFGVGRLPQVGGALGKAIREFRKSQKSEDETVTQSKAEKPASEEPPKAPGQGNRQEH